MKKILVAVLCSVCAVGAAYAGTDVYIGLEARGKHLNLGIAKFLPKNISIEESKMCRAIESVVRYDLLFSLYFNLVEGGPIPTLEGKVDFKQWKQLGADALITGRCAITEQKLTVEVRLFDVDGGAVIWQQTVENDMKNYRFIAHTISDEIVLRFTGEKGIARTRILFSNNATGNKEIYVADYDGHNVERLTDDRSIVLFPRWSPDGKKIIYTSYRDKNPDLFMIDADGKNRRPLSVRQGLNTAGRWSPDGRHIALTLSLGKDPNIYLINTQGQMVRKITSDRGAETAPDFSPQGNEIVYTSDRPGYPQLYVTTIYGGGDRRLFNGNYCDSPVWSPLGNSIAFVMLSEDKSLDVYVIDIFGRRPKRLTFNSRKNENPSWSPDGRFIVFVTTRNWISELYIMSADGTNQHRLLNIQGNSFTPCWGPYIDLDSP